VVELQGMTARPSGMTTPTRGAATAALALLMVLAACSSRPGASGAITTAAGAAQLALAQQPRFAGIAPFDENLIGQASWYQVTAAEDGWQVLIRIGWGDCPAGCINEHRWTYAVGKNARVELVRETGDPLPDATGVRGTVSAGPTCPVERDPPDPACAPRLVAGAVLVVTDAAGTEVARATSAEDGTFSIDLGPGAYRLTAQPVEGLMGTPEPMDFEVEAGGPMTELQVSYDTGIR
jgi:hypothetical protein